MLTSLLHILKLLTLLLLLLKGKYDSHVLEYSTVKSVRTGSNLVNISIILLSNCDLCNLATPLASQWML